MYSSVASLHIALDARIQEQNSNRKIAIFPEQYDMVLNDAISTVLKNRISARLNVKQEGYEDSVTSYDGLKSLKRVYKPICYYDSISEKWSFDLPSDYYMFDTLQANINFDRRSTVHNTVNATVYKSIITFKNIGDNPYIFKKDIIRYTNLDGIVTPDLIHLVGTSNKSSFYYFTLIKDYFKSKKKIQCYFENYLDEYYPNSLIFISDTANIPTGVTVRDSTDTTAVDVTNKITVQTSTLTSQVKRFNTSTEINMGSKTIDLISSLNDTNEDNDFYLHYNRHLNPKCIMENGKVYLTTDTTFNYNNLRLSYLKQPRFIDSRIGQMTDIDITEDILDTATVLLMRTLNIRDPYAEQSASNKQNK